MKKKRELGVPSVQKVLTLYDLGELISSVEISFKK